MRVLIVGCGYVGVPLGHALAAQGHEVFGLRRSSSSDALLKDAGIVPLIGDVIDPASLAALPGPFDWVVNTVASSHGGEADYRQVYLEGTRNLIQWLAAQTPPLKKFVYTSSTGVYGQTDGSLVKESSPTLATTPTSQILIETENLLLAAHRESGFPAVILRVAGIYGPDRGYWFQKFLRNEARIADRGERIINMIHRDDVAGAIVAALKSGRPGEIYNAVDDEPVTHLQYFRWLAETLGKYMPPFGEDDEPAARKRALTHKKVSNRRLKMELGYVFKYPTFRQGYTAEITRLDRAGQLDIPLEPR